MPTCINPLYYGMKFFNMALDLTVANTMLAVPTLTTFGANNTADNVTAYCVQQSATQATVIMTNKSATNYFQPAITFNWVCTSATIEIMTVTDPVNEGLATKNWSTSMDTYAPQTVIGGATIEIGGSFSQTPQIYSLNITNNGNGTSTVTCWLPIVSAVLITVMH